MESCHPSSNGPVMHTQNPLDSQNTSETTAEHGEQDADDEGAEDTDDTRSERLFVPRFQWDEGVGGTR